MFAGPSTIQIVLACLFNPNYTCFTALYSNQSSNDLTLREVFECICVGGLSRNTVALFVRLSMHKRL